MSLLTTLKDHLTQIKQSIDAWCDEQDRDMEQWKEEDPEAYYEHLALQQYDKY